MYCKKCGGVIPDDSMFCQFCGNPADRMDFTAPIPNPFPNFPNYQPPPAEPVRKPKISLFSAVESGILMIIIIVSFIGMFRFPIVSLKARNAGSVSFSFAELYEDLYEDVETILEVIFDENIMALVCACATVLCIIISLIFIISAIVKLAKCNGEKACKSLCWALRPLSVAFLTMALGNVSVLNIETWVSAKITLIAIIMPVITFILSFVGVLLAEDHA